MSSNVFKRLSIIFVLLAFCSPVLAQEFMTERFVREMANSCDWDRLLEYQEKKRPAERVLLAKDVDYIDTDGTDVYLYRYSCYGEGEDEAHVFYVAIMALKEFWPVHFAAPTYTIEDMYASDGQTHNQMSLMKMTGFGTIQIMASSSFDSDTKTLTVNIKDASDGSAYTYGQWKWDVEQFEFVLKHYEVDNSHDGIKNPTLRISFP